VSAGAGEAGAVLFGEVFDFDCRNHIFEAEVKVEAEAEVEAGVEVEVEVEA
jgi:hypothetical protein